MAELLSTNPFLLALLAAMVAETCAILIRAVTPSLSWWFWWLANLVSILALVSFLWSFLWATSVREDFIEILSVPETILGVLSIVGGGGMLLWSFASLGWRSFFAWPTASFETRHVYAHIRRPMFVGAALFFLGVALLLSRDALWIWMASWIVLSQPLLELEEWELRLRFPMAKDYYTRTKRYIPRRRKAPG
jgi:protein-S-isoprenylcysteine O-methyltransferase Ste14